MNYKIKYERMESLDMVVANIYKRYFWWWWRHILTYRDHTQGKRKLARLIDGNFIE